MKAAVVPRYGPPEVLQITEVEKPTPKDDQMLIRVRATSVTSGDCRLRGARPFLVRFFMGFLRPKRAIIGSDLAGEVEAVGKDVTRFNVGDRVFGEGVSTYAEYTCLLEGGPRVLMPTDVTFEEAAAIPFGASSSLDFFRRGHVGEGQKVLIYGASGAVGTAAVQLAKASGAEVVGVCSTANLDLVKSLGADEVIDYTKEDFTSPATYDVVFDAVGKSSFFRCMKSLKKGGVYLDVLALFPLLRRLWASLSGKRFIGGVAKTKPGDIDFLKQLLEEGKLRAVIDRTYPLEQVVEAHRYVERGHKKGNVVITM